LQDATALVALRSVCGLMFLNTLYKSQVANRMYVCNFGLILPLRLHYFVEMSQSSGERSSGAVFAPSLRNLAYVQLGQNFNRRLTRFFPADCVVGKLCVRTAASEQSCAGGVSMGRHNCRLN
jgi:hypothetical protein